MGCGWLSGFWVVEWVVGGRVGCGSLSGLWVVEWVVGG